MCSKVDIEKITKFGNSIHNSIVVVNFMCQLARATDIWLPDIWLNIILGVSVRDEINI